MFNISIPFPFDVYKLRPVNKGGFDGVPGFQVRISITALCISLRCACPVDLLIISLVKTSLGICMLLSTIYLFYHLRLNGQQDIEQELSKVSGASRGPGVSQHIVEQYETKLQELKPQLSLSKKHSEEMLWKLQDTIDEIEKRKKSEASHMKINEELGMKILELEAEL
ncbi:hypothetical protein RJT34_20259 [Clitoria ternatea]|uniref:Uncharacterized protein n=1 Tax=Clitoria ternatea TaxID=43366 RepID=A0AAN9P5L2_CLITE